MTLFVALRSKCKIIYQTGHLSGFPTHFHLSHFHLSARHTTACKIWLASKVFNMTVVRTVVCVIPDLMTVSITAFTANNPAEMKQGSHARHSNTSLLSLVCERPMPIRHVRNLCSTVHTNTTVNQVKQQIYSTAPDTVIFSIQKLLLTARNSHITSFRIREILH